MEVNHKIETRILRTKSGSLTLEYRLLARQAQKSLCAPFGMEIVVRTASEERREVCRNLTSDRRKALALIHLFAAHCVIPAAPAESVSRCGDFPPTGNFCPDDGICAPNLRVFSQKTGPISSDFA